MTILSIQEVSKSFGGTKALDGVDLSVEERTVTLMIGPNGSGKTTLINVIAGFYKAETGRITFRGRDITSLQPHQVCAHGLVRTFQVPAPFQKLTVLENLMTSHMSNPGESFLKAPLRRLWRHDEERIMERAFKILELLKLGDLWNLEASKLSGGQIKLLEIGRALMSSAKMLLMDEPIAGVNPVLAHEILKHIIELRRTLGITFFIVEHRLDIALQYVDTVHVMDRGRIISQGSPEIVVKDPRVIEAYLGS